ncbi:MAG: hypothetical protein GEU83_02120 [Pseudonocardiaceae bacterium]|nr:hypothetical protein [Pseudonocardiaceae bacterium]
MSTTMVIVLGIVVWIMLAIALALLLGRMIRLRDRHAPPAADAPSESPNGNSGAGSHTQHDLHRHDSN